MPTKRPRALWAVVLALIFLFSAGCPDIALPPADSPPVEFNQPDAVPVIPATEGSAEYTRRPVFLEIPGKVGSHAATLTTFPDGELLAAWYSYDGPHELTGSAIYMSRRPVGQDSWQEPWMHIDRPWGDGNPVLYSESERVWLFQAVAPGLWSTAHIEMQISQDRGRTWSEPVGLPGPIGANARFAPLRTQDGEFLLPAYDDLLQRSIFYRSSNGLEWELVAAIATSPAAIQPSVARLADGQLVSVMRNTAGGWLWVMDSSDSGQSWSVPQDSGFANPNSPAAILGLKSGNLLLIYNDSPTDRVRFTAALSADGGRTWPCRRLLAEAGENCSYPSVIQSGDGRIHIVFSVGRERIDHISCNEAWIAQASTPP